MATVDSPPELNKILFTKRKTILTIACLASVTDPKADISLTNNEDKFKSLNPIFNSDLLDKKKYPMKIAVTIYDIVVGISRSKNVVHLLYNSYNIIYINYEKFKFICL